MNSLHTRCDSIACSAPDQESARDRVAPSSTSNDRPFERPCLLDELRSRGVRLTVQRRAVVETIQEAPGHLDAASLLAKARLREPQIDRATVYRTLDLLKRHQLVDELDLLHLNGERHFYEVRTRRQHIHLACFECGRVEELANGLFELLQEEISRQTGFTARVTRLELGGCCQTCKSKQEVDSVVHS